MANTFARAQVERLEKLLASNVGMTTVTVGNTTVTYEGLVKQFDYWRSKLARQNGQRPRAAQINLGGF